MSGGVFLTKGMMFGVEPFSLTIGDDGEITGPAIQLRLSFDVCPVWVKIAHKHLEDAKQRKAATLAVWPTDDNDAKADALENEFEASVQAITAAVVAIDALYAWLKPHAGLDEDTLKKWRANGTSRYKQVGEVFRRCLGLKEPKSNELTDYLGQLYGLRDRAVHPSAKTQAVLTRPDIAVGVEWRFATYSADAIELPVLSATGIIYDLSRLDGIANEKVKEHMARLRVRLEQLFPTGHPVDPHRKKKASDSSTPATTAPGDSATSAQSQKSQPPSG